MSTTSGSTWMTGREACAVLAEAGISSWRGRQALTCGLAGTPVRTRAAHLYDGDRVRALARRRVVTEAEMRERAPHGYYVWRGAVRVDVPPQEELPREVRAEPRGMSIFTAALLQLDCSSCEGLPFVATVAGFVALGADLHGFDADGLILRPPGPWFDELRETRLPSGTGRTWTWQSRLAWAARPPRQWVASTP